MYVVNVNAHVNVDVDVYVVNVNAHVNANVLSVSGTLKYADSGTA